MANSPVHVRPETDHKTKQADCADPSTSDTSAMGMAALIVGAFVIYAMVFIWKSSFLFAGTRFFVLLDDSMVSMRYGQNLANGYGLVWNPGGEHVEGYTNLLWVLYMALVHLMPLPNTQTSLVIQITGLVCLLACGALTWMITNRLTGSWWAAFCSMSICLFYYPMINWFLLGSEVSVFAVILLVLVWQVVRRTIGNGDGASGPVTALPWHFHALAACCVLLRADGVILCVAIFLLLYLSRLIDRRCCVTGLSVVLLTAVGQTAFRYSYYHDVLPNTYYLKMYGYPAMGRISTGALKLGEFLLSSFLVIPVGIVLSLRGPRRPLVRVMLGAAGVQMAYSVLVGGDAWEYWGGSNRYIAIIIPLLIIASVAGCHAILRRRIVESGDGGANARPRKAMAIFGAALFLVALAALEYPCRAGGPPFASPLLTNMPGVEGNPPNVLTAVIAKVIFKPGASMAVQWAGATPYFSGFRSYDLLGKCDQIVAHTSMHAPPGRALYTDFMPGDLKWDYAYSIGACKPDFIATADHLYADSAPYINSKYLVASCYGVAFAVRRDSPYVDWNAVRTLHR